MYEQFLKKLHELSYFETRKELIPCYLQAYEQIPEGLLDSNFIKKISDSGVETRLSEIIVTNFLVGLGLKNITGKSNGPDLVIDMSDYNCNVEIVTPIKVTSSQKKIGILSSTNSNRGFEETILADSDSLAVRVASVFVDKVKQYQDWKAKEVISSQDINIILINLGFVQDLFQDEIPHLWNIFYNEEAIFIEQSNDQNIQADVEKSPHRIKKANGTAFDTSYFDTKAEGTELIASVLVMDLREPFCEVKFSQKGRFDNPFAINPLCEELESLFSIFKSMNHLDYHFLRQLEKDGCVHKV